MTDETRFWNVLQKSAIDEIEDVVESKQQFSCVVINTNDANVSYI